MVRLVSIVLLLSLACAIGIDFQLGRELKHRVSLSRHRYTQERSLARVAREALEKARTRAMAKKPAALTSSDTLVEQEEAETRRWIIVHEQKRRIESLEKTLQDQAVLLAHARARLKTARTLATDHPIEKTVETDENETATRNKAAPAALVSRTAPPPKPQAPDPPGSLVRQDFINHKSAVQSLEKQLADLKRAEDNLTLEARHGAANQDLWGDGEDMRSLNQAINQKEDRIRALLAAIESHTDPRLNLEAAKEEIKAETQAVQQLMARRKALTREWSIQGRPRSSYSAGAAAGRQEGMPESMMEGMMELETMAKLVSAQLESEKLALRNAEEALAGTDAAKPLAASGK